MIVGCLWLYHLYEHKSIVKCLVRASPNPQSLTVPALLFPDYEYISIECPIPDVGNAIRDRYTRQRCVIKCRIPDAGNAIRDRYIRQLSFPERSIPDTGNTIRDHYSR